MVQHLNSCPTCMKFWVWSLAYPNQTKPIYISYIYEALDCLHKFAKTISLSSSWPNYIYSTLRGWVIGSPVQCNDPGTIPGQRFWSWRMAPGHTQGTVDLRDMGEGCVPEARGCHRPETAGSCWGWCPFWVPSFPGSPCCPSLLRIRDAKWTRMNGWG